LNGIVGKKSAKRHVLTGYTRLHMLRQNFSETEFYTENYT